MATKLRLARGGAKKNPYYRLVAADSRAPRDGKFIERLGSYNPFLKKDDPNRVILNKERIKYWLDSGAKPTEKVEKFLVEAQLYRLDKSRQAILDTRIKKSQEEKRKKEAAAQKVEDDAKKKALEEAKKEEETQQEEAASTADEEKKA